jgi:Fis family transcriptional regulator
MLNVVMQHVSGNQSQAAEMLGISRSTLRRKLRQYNLE